MSSFAAAKALHSPFLISNSSSSLHLKLISSYRSSYRPTSTNRRSYYPSIRALDLDQNTIVAISVGVVSVAVGIGIPVFYESQIDNASEEEIRPRLIGPGSGRFGGSEACWPRPMFNQVEILELRFCTGIGSVTVELGGEEKEISRCINCDGMGSLTCTTCQGSGIQPRYLDRSAVVGTENSKMTTKEELNSYMSAARGTNSHFMTN
ncbi:hypothetical protein BVC80_1831g131 [Macleaya cordata]|uniref:Heat shock protein DnaJ n=1 Tax=Macleaya cordata TaxID=56857 RepID=A0A200R797_MACCD|nr:hypothetical protein BVC80_1831g131 [Macleaya cordata]